MSENTINQAFRRMGYGAGEITADGLRTTASTLLNESGKWSPDAIERSLAHADTNAIRGTCNRGFYWEERVAINGGAIISTSSASTENWKHEDGDAARREVYRMIIMLSVT